MLDSCKQCHDDLRLVEDNGKLKFVCDSQCGYEQEWLIHETNNQRFGDRPRHIKTFKGD